MDNAEEKTTDGKSKKPKKEPKKETVSNTVPIKSKESQDGSDQGDSSKPLECLVCGDEASGMHYRAITCEGCKTFFRRNAARRALLKCDLDEGKCVINTYLRRHCAFCRMKKCLAVGMEVTRVWDKERVKTRKRIVKKPKMEPENLPETSKALPTYVKVEIPPDIEEMIQKVEQAYDKSHGITQDPANRNELPKPLKEFVVQPTDTATTSTQEPSNLTNIKKEDTEEQVHSSCSHCDKDSATADSSVNIKLEPETEQSSTSPKTEQSITTVHDKPETTQFNQLTESDDKYNDLPLTPESYKSGKISPPSCSGKISPSVGGASPSPSSSIETMFFSQQQMPSMMSPTYMQSDLENSKVAQKGMELMKTLMPSNSTSNMMLTSYIMKMSLIALRSMIGFCKELPVFSELTWESQAALIKGAFIEFIFIGSIYRFDPKLQRVESYFMPGTAYTREICEKAGLGDVFDKLSALASRIFPLKAGKREFSLMFAIAVLAPDRPGLDDECKDAVGEIQEKLAHALRLCFESKGPEGRLNFPKAMMVLTDLRNTTETYRNAVMQVELHANVITPLLAELFDVT